MTFEEYEEGALLTWANTFDRDSIENRVLISLGLTGESGEVADLVKKVFGHGHPFNETTKSKVAEELGDLLYYLSLMAWSIRVPLEEIAIINRKKLRARYEGGFSTEASMNRLPG